MRSAGGGLSWARSCSRAVAKIHPRDHRDTLPPPTNDRQANGAPLLQFAYPCSASQRYLQRKQVFSMPLASVHCVDIRHGSPLSIFELRGPIGMSVRKKLLLVDDERDAVEAMSLLLELEGYEARVACSGNEALRAVETFCRTSRSSTKRCRK